MKVGDLVRELGYPDSLGVIVAQVDEPRALHNEVFRVLWTNGEVGEKIWDYDLTKVEA
tara:strand:+ start:335 stop:508 length:174 start_codon:yes stop_codon:yes gene_type:complete